MPVRSYWHRPSSHVFEPHAMKRCLGGCDRLLPVDKLEYGICTRCMFGHQQRPKHSETCGKWVTVMKCPHGEFSAGSRFGEWEFMDTLKEGNFPAGMVVRMGGRFLAVCAGKPETLRRVG